ncbi:MAG: DEAD/DEAH box helicase [Candidatus Nomurabacteria bacterium]|nr:DEAD/DEAH box helicase [Candidatus Nomurabacteria bacterium]USN88035.1 MAG: DEAD/DEAH box helicase [Candidatus Nomurabacteria bacterium]
MQSTSSRTNRPAGRGRRTYSSSPNRSGFNTRRPFSRSTSNHNGGGFSRSNFRRNGHGGSRRREQTTFDVSKYINLNPVTPTKEVYENKHTFSDFALDKDLKKAINDAGLVTPSPIQDQVIPLILDGKDVVGLAETGTGKTAAFLIPTIQKTLVNRSSLTLILAPTRELAIQVEQELRKLTPKMGIFSTACVGGMNILPQIKNLRRRNHFIIGTPGRVQDLIDRGSITPERITGVILDEADRMLDMGFIHDIKKILKDIPAKRSTLFFSATMSKSIESLIHDFLKDPITISVRKTDVASSISQDVIKYENHHKFDTLVLLLKKPTLTRVIIFGAMKHSVEKLSQELNQAGIRADAIHGNKSHGQRQQALRRFKSGQVQVLVATDVAARGIHVDNVSHVINYDLPNTYEDYIHRIGRTGRGDKRGEALTFVPA